MHNHIRLGIDLGGTKIELIALDSHGQQRLRQRIATPPNGYYAIVDAITSLVSQVYRQLGAPSYSLGLGIPGAISPQTGLVKNANTTCLIGQDLPTDLNNRLNLIAPVRIANDADCLALSEASDGAGEGYRSVFAVIIGTGCGGGWVIQQQLHSGPNAIAGEWGHNPLPWSDANDHPLPCYCGKLGCTETYVSGPGMSQHAERLSGRKHSAEHWHQLALTGDAEALKVMTYYQRCLARALASIINVMDPAAIVLGGGLSNIASLYDTIPTLWSDYVFSDQVVTPLLQAQHGDSSGVRGAARLGGQSFMSQ